MKSFRILAVAAVAASMSLVACGGDAADTNATDTTATIDSMPAPVETPSTPTIDTTAAPATGDTTTAPAMGDTTATSDTTR